MSEKREKRIRRHAKIRMDIIGTKDRPRLCVFRSNQHLYAKLIDNQTGDVLLSVSDKDITTKKGTKSEIAKAVGKLAAEKAAAKKIETVVFDRGGFIFHGRVKALAEGAREGGLKF